MINMRDKMYYKKKLNMSSGYVGDFSDRTFGEFFMDFGIDIHSKKYQIYGTSKAKKLSAFWEIESEEKVMEVMREMISFQSDDYQPECVRGLEKRDDESEKMGEKINIHAEKGSSVNIGDNNKVQNGKKSLISDVAEKVVERIFGI